jgi:hypothetical protein
LVYSRIILSYPTIIHADGNLLSEAIVDIDALLTVFVSKFTPVTTETADVVTSLTYP